MKIYPLKICIIICIIVVVGFVAIHVYRNRAKQTNTQTVTLQNASYPPSQSSDLPLSCQIASVTKLASGIAGDLFSASDPDIVYGTLKTNSIDQVYSVNIKTKEQACITCADYPGKPSSQFNTGQAQVDPSGRYMVLVAEMPQHPGGHEIATGGQGWFLNIWAWDMISNKWYNLTNYSLPSSNGSDLHGVLIPRLSPDGKRLAWAELYSADFTAVRKWRAGLTATGPVMGNWRVTVADISFTPNQVSLSNIKHFQPGNADYYEMEKWTPDGTRIAMSTDIGQDSPLKSNIYLINANTGDATPFTNTANQWNEQMGFSPDGSKAAFMSSRCCTTYDPNNPKWQATLSTDIYLSNGDGSNPAQLTHFNSPGYPESQARGGIAFTANFNKDSTALLVSDVNRADGTYGLYQFNFKGVCGGK